MARLIVLSTLLISCTLACAPHKPTRPSRPAPPVCGKLDPLWAKSACESVSPGAFTCVDPAEHSATRFECPPQHTIIVKTSPTNDYEELKSLTCDPNSREWMFEFGTKKLTKTEFMKLPNKGGPLEYKCYIPN